MSLKFLLQTIISLLFCISLYSQTPTVVINEFMAANDSLSQWTDPAGQHEDWIELHNHGTSTINLGGYYLSDKDTLLEKWQFPAGVTIPANGYLIIWADEDLSQTGLHADFKLDRDGEQVILSDPGLNIIDSVNFGSQDDNISYARLPNAIGNFIKTTPTFNANNGTSANRQPVWANQVLVYPNPVKKGLVMIELPRDKQLEIQDIVLYTADSRRMQPLDYQTGSMIIIDLPLLPSGFYFLLIVTDQGNVVKKLQVAN